MIEVKIRVSKVQSDGTLKELYRNSVQWSEDIQFPFNSVYSTLRILYPATGVVIQFMI